MTDDRFNLERFVAAQEESYERALAELKAGRKESHWMWYIFPQVAGLGHSSMAQKYAIRNGAEAAAYLAHEVLGPRLIACCDALLGISDKTGEEVLGHTDNLKLKSSMTLFSEVAPQEVRFARVLEKFFDGQRDKRTLQFLQTNVHRQYLFGVTRKEN